MYIIVVGKAGSGKTPAFVEVIDKPMRELQKELKFNVDLQEFTRASMLSFMTTTKGTVWSPIKFTINTRG